MKKLLISSFEPFGGEQINSSRQAVEALPNEIGAYSLTKMCIPVVFGEAADGVIAAADALSPDVIISVGQAAGRDAITPEMVGINLRYAKIPDNSGYEPKDEIIFEDGERAYFSTLPVRKMAEAVNNAGVPASVSYSAGAYVCNDVLYILLKHFENSKTKVGFIHVPCSKEQNKQISMDINDIVKGLTAAIESLD
jgi:pyroglutamyl-peptidase